MWFRNKTILGILYKDMIHSLGKSDQIDMSKLRGYQKS